MRKLLLGVAIGAAIFVGVAHAQPPQEVTIPEQDTITLQPGQWRTFKFNESVKEIGTPTEGIVQITPQSDRTFTFQGIAPGDALVIARAEDGHVVHSMVITVEGHLVKLYGYPDVKDYISYPCTKTGCGRADPDAPKAGSESVTVTKPTRDGSGWVSTRKNYP